ncbi:cyclin-D3-1 [Pyrus ussuriensis x Pyrus communis]|uniref:B-like cyclin n=1 Tax=Pyrus ussuriensis x Pyrus communis TaxID=2448454 RepID=A0A5N5I9X5_9ROSA|nr:cyclin-D3-1 [Pyrus ussuriensis x Pyrus communis]
MAMNHDQHQNPQSHSLLLDALLCEEDKWEEEDDGEVVEQEVSSGENYNNGVSGKNPNCPSLFPMLLLEQDLFWEDDELVSLFSKEEQQQTHFVKHMEGMGTEDSLISAARRDAVLWMLKVNAHYGFTALTAILAVNYFDRFISSLHFQRDKPWMVQLVAVTCLSLAAKVEETEVPLLLDLQVEDTKYFFEAKTIQRMEILVLSALHWRMHPVTPLSFLDHIIRRLGLKTHLHWEFLKRCERLLLSVVFDSRFVRYLPSVLATATMMRVIDQVEPWNAIEYQNQLLGVLKISKEKVNDCYSLIIDYDYACSNNKNSTNKRKHDQIPGSPSAVIDAYFSYESSNDSWPVGSSVSSSPQALFKRTRKAEAEEKETKLASLSRLFVGIVGSPP